MSAALGRQDGRARRGGAKSADEGSVIARHVQIIIALALVLAGAIAIHRFHPEYWPPLAVDIMHSLHGTGFALLAIVVHRILQWRYPNKVNYLMAGIVTGAIGVISEAAQIPGPRDAQFSDLIVDGLGIFGALGLLAASDRVVREQLGRRLRLALPALAGLSLGIACLPTVWLSYALTQQYLAFPQLNSFEHVWERATFGQTSKARPRVVAAPPDWPVAGESVAQAQESGRWGIMISLDPLPDWRGHSQVSFVVASSGEPFRLGIGMRDMRQPGDHGIRFYKSVPIDATPRRVSVTFEEILAREAERPFDFGRVESLVLSADDPGKGAGILVDDFRLDP